MEPYYQDDKSTIYCADCRSVLAELQENSIDAIVTDPPYHLTTGKKGGSGEASVNLESPYGRARITTGFMGMKWDGGDIAHSVEMWSQCLRVLKPGGHILSFGGSRTYHRMACAIEDAGFEIRDQIMWLYGSGFPKSLNLGDGRGTALKPAHEPICVARKPLIGTVAGNVAEYGTGALNIDACRVGYESETDRVAATPQGKCTSKSGRLAGKTQGGGERASFDRPKQLGRWPANVIHDGSDEVVSLFPTEAGAAAPVTTRNKDKFRNTFGEFSGNIDEQGSTFHNDFGSAARFFYCAKADRWDRNEGCEDLDKKPLLWSSGTKNPGSFQAEGTDRNSRNNHPTVKPTDLMRYLCRLVTQPGGIVLDPFMGSGSTRKAALKENLRFIGVDIEERYCEISVRRTPQSVLDFS